MNYYVHHLGDYVRDTAHLSMVEDGAYRRLLDAYYIKEHHLPSALKDVFRLARATSKLERDAVQAVLNEFFEDTPDGWRHGRCDAEIHRFREKAPEREGRRENERDRQRRCRERRRQLFDELREHGIVPAYGASMAELQTLIERLEHRHAEVSEAQPAAYVTTPVTRDATATHTPSTNHQSPNKEPENTHADAAHAGASPEAAVCMALKQAGIPRVNPGDPRLSALLARGANVSNFVAAASGAIDKRNPFSYLLATVDGQLTDAASIAAGPQRAVRPKPRTRTDDRVATLAGLTGTTIEPFQHASRARSTESPVDVECHRVG